MFCEKTRECTYRSLRYIYYSTIVERAENSGDTVKHLSIAGNSKYETRMSNETNKCL